MSKHQVSLQELELKRLREDPRFLDYRKGVSQLKTSGVLDFLRKFSRPFLLDNGRDVQASAAAAAHSMGFHAALDQIEHFEEIYVMEQVNPKSLTMDFGGLNLAIQKGHITEEDKNGRK